MMQELHWKRAVIAVIAFGVFGVSTYLVTSPNADVGVAVGIAVACGVVVAALGLLFFVSRRRIRARDTL